MQSAGRCGRECGEAKAAPQSAEAVAAGAPLASSTSATPQKQSCGKAGKVHVNPLLPTDVTWSLELPCQDWEVGVETSGEERLGWMSCG